MSPRTVVAWLIIALALGAAAMGVRWYQRGQAAPDLVEPMTFNPTVATEIRIQSPAGHAVARRGEAGRWVLSVEGEPDWPLDASRVSGALRLLADVGSRPAESNRLTTRHACEVQVVAGETWTLRMWDLPISGAVPGEVILSGAARAVRVDRALWDALGVTGVSAWRESSLVGDAAALASRVTLKTKSAEVRLVKVDGRWGLASPATPADAGAVAGLLRAIGSASVARFPSEAEIAGLRTGLEDPSSELIVETDRRMATPTGATWESDAVRVRIGLPASIDSTRLFVGVSRQTGAGKSPERVVIIPAADLIGVTMDWTVYASRASVADPATDVGTIIIQRTEPAPGAELTLKRTTSGWQATNVTGQSVQLPEGLSGDALTRVLTEAKAASVRLAGASPSVLVVKLLGLSGGHLAELHVLDEGEGLVIRAGEVERVYSTGGELLALMVEALAGLEAR